MNKINSSVADTIHLPVKEILDAIWSSSEDAIIAKDLNGLVIAWNDAAESIYGYKASEMLGRSVAVLFPKDRIYELKNLLSLARMGKKVYHAESIMLRKDGIKFDASITTTPILDSDTTVVGSLTISRDITERKRLEDVRKSNVELEQFAYVVSHDLKAPLRGIFSIAEWIVKDNREKLDEKSKRHLALLETRLIRMQNLIDGILEYSRVGRIHEEPRLVDLNKLVAQLVDTLAPPKHIKVKVQNKLPSFSVEKTRIQQVFQNLLSNAINYMDKKEGLIEIGCEEDHNFWKFYIKDNGPGIEQKHFEKIFQIFQTLAPKDVHESTGIGLTLVKKIIELYGGTVWIESEVKKGSTFFFTIPKPRKAKQ